MSPERSGGETCLKSCAFLMAAQMFMRYVHAEATDIKVLSMHVVKLGER
jgi:hypothetical protein